MFWRRRTSSFTIINVPTRKPWVRRWLFRAVRFSFLAMIVGGLWQAWNDFNAYHEAIFREARSEIGYQCAARLDDNLLASRANEYGNIDVGTIGCADGPFYVSMAEVRDMRAGRMKFETVLSTFYFDRVLIFGAGTGIFTLLISATAIVALRTIQWAWG